MASVRENATSRPACLAGPRPPTSSVLRARPPERGDCPHSGSRVSRYNSLAPYSTGIFRQRTRSEPIDDDKSIDDDIAICQAPQGQSRITPPPELRCPLL